MNPELSKKLLLELRNLTRRDSRLNVNELRVIVALERVVARLQSDPSLMNHLIFKGGFVLLKHFGSQRFTRDADALAVTISKEELNGMVRKALMKDLDDGIWYGDIQAMELEEQGKYGALRFDVAFHIGEPKTNKIPNLSRIHLDIGFSDQLTESALTEVMHPLFDSKDPISWKIYPMEQIIAEKLETLFHRNIANSRAKDIYDLIFLMPRSRDQIKLVTAIQHTFKNRGTSLPQSFCEDAKAFSDLSLLESAWPGIRTTDDKPSFATAWKTLLDHLKNLDLSQSAAE